MGRFGAVHLIEFLYVVQAVQMSLGGRVSPGAQSVCCNAFGRLLYDAGSFGALAQSMLGMTSGDLEASWRAFLSSRRPWEGRGIVE